MWFNSSSPAHFPEWSSNLQTTRPPGTCQCSCSGLKPLKLLGSEWMRQPRFAPAALAPRPFPPRWAFLENRPERRRSWRVAVLTRRDSSEPGCTPRTRWGKRERVSSCGACRSSWSCGGRRRRPGPEKTAACSSQRWSVRRNPPGGRRRSRTCAIHPWRPDGPRTRYLRLARPLP